MTVPRAGAYRLWAEGNVGRALTATVDGRAAGAVGATAAADGNVLRFDTLRLTAGTHVLRLVRAGGGPAPGNAASRTPRAIALEPPRTRRIPLRSLPLADWRALCGQQLDWIETV